MQSSGIAKLVLKTVNAPLHFPAIYNRPQTELGLQEGRRQNFFSVSVETQYVQKPPNQSWGAFWDK